MIRCHLSPVNAGQPVRGYHIQHVQSGAEFRSAALSEINQWMAKQNLSYLTDALNTSTALTPEVDDEGGVR